MCCKFICSDLDARCSENGLSDRVLPQVVNLVILNIWDDPTTHMAPLWQTGQIHIHFLLSPILTNNQSFYGAILILLLSLYRVPDKRGY